MPIVNKTTYTQDKYTNQDLTEIRQNLLQAIILVTKNMQFRVASQTFEVSVDTRLTSLCDMSILKQGIHFLITITIIIIMIIIIYSKTLAIIIYNYNCIMHSIIIIHMQDRPLTKAEVVL